MILLRDDRGATAIEWGLIAAMIAVVVVTLYSTVGSGRISSRTAEAPKVSFQK